MFHVKSLNDFEVLIGTSLDICTIEVEGEPYHNVIKLYSYLDFDKGGMCAVEPSMCYVDDYLSQKDIYKDIWEYASDFSSFDIPISIEDDAIYSLAHMCVEHTRKANNVDEIGKLLLYASEIDSLRKLEAGIYLVGFLKT